MSKLTKNSNKGTRLATVSMAAMIAVGMGSMASAQTSSYNLVDLERFAPANSSTNSSAPTTGPLNAANPVGNPFCNTNTFDPTIGAGSLQCGELSETTGDDATAVGQNAFANGTGFLGSSSDWFKCFRW